MYVMFLTRSECIFPPLSQFSQLTLSPVLSCDSFQNECTQQTTKKKEKKAGTQEGHGEITASCGAGAQN